MSVDAVALATLHAQCFETPRPWSAGEFADLLADDKTVFAGDRHGFVLGRVVADEAELLTIAVPPAARRRGLGRQLLSEFEASVAARGAIHCYLEVAADNLPAIALYHSQGYVESGRRTGYYTRKNTAATDAILLSRTLKTN